MPSLARFEQPAPPARAGLSPDPRSSEVLRLSNQGQDAEAARLAAALIAEGHVDVGVLARHLFGIFLERGFVALPVGLDALAQALEAALDTQDKRTLAEAELALGWYCRSVRDRIEFHLALRDATLDAWVASAAPEVADATRAACASLTVLLTGRVSDAVAVEQIAAMDGFADGTLRALLRHAEPEPAPAPLPRGATAPLAATPPLAPLPARRAGPPAPDTISADCDSPALRELRRKLAAFQTLMDRGDLARAAIIARDIDHILESFDPRVYLPRLFVPYFRSLADGAPALSPHWEDEGSLSWKALDQLYRVDLDAFLGEP